MIKEVLGQLATFAGFLAAAGIGAWLVLWLTGEDTEKTHFRKWEREIRKSKQEESK